MFQCWWTSEWTKIVSSFLHALWGFFDSVYFLYCPCQRTCKSAMFVRVLKCCLYIIYIIILNHSDMNNHDFVQWVICPYVLVKSHGTKYIKQESIHTERILMIVVFHYVWKNMYDGIIVKRQCEGYGLPTVCKGQRICMSESWLNCCLRICHVGRVFVFSEYLDHQIHCPENKYEVCLVLRWYDNCLVYVIAQKSLNHLTHELQRNDFGLKLWIW